MADEKNINPAPQKTEKLPVAVQPDIEAALKEYNEAADRVKVIAKYPFLVSILNNQTK